MYTITGVTGHVGGATAELPAQLEKPVDVVTIPRLGWIPALLDAGLPEPLSQELATVDEAETRALFQSRGDREHDCTTRTDDTPRLVLKSATGPAEQAPGSGESRR